MNAYKHKQRSEHEVMVGAKKKSDEIYTLFTNKSMMMMHVQQPTSHRICHDAYPI